MTEVTLRVHYERPYSEYVTLDIPDDIEVNSDEYHEYIADNLPVVEAMAEDWEIRDVGF